MGSHGGGDAAPNMQEMMSNLMANLMPGAKANPERLTGVAALAFQNKTRGAASIPEDKSISIFDRITFRYFMNFTTLTGQPLSPNTGVKK